MSEAEPPVINPVMHQRFQRLRCAGQLFFSALLICAHHGLVAQSSEERQAVPFNYPPLPEQVLNPDSASPEGWHLIQVAEGDLNNDARPDFVIAVQYQDSVVHIRPDGGFSSAQPRVLAVYLSTSEKEFSLLEQSNSFLLRADEGDMMSPELELRFAQDTLKILFQFTRSSADYSFQFRAGQLECIRFNNGGVSGGRLHFQRMDLVRNTALLHEGEIDQDGFDHEEVIQIPPHPALTIGRLAMPFRTELAPRVWL